MPNQQKKKKWGSNGPHFLVLKCTNGLFGYDRLDHDEHDQKGEQNERLDQSESNDHQRLNLSGCSRVAGSTLSGTRADEALADGG